MTGKVERTHAYVRRVAAEATAREMRRQLIVAGQYIVLMLIAATVAVVWMA
jgi:hypothetical protein